MLRLVNEKLYLSVAQSSCWLVGNINHAVPGTISSPSQQTLYLLSYQNLSGNQSLGGRSLWRSYLHPSSTPIDQITILALILNVVLLGEAVLFLHSSAPTCTFIFNKHFFEKAIYLLPWEPLWGGLQNKIQYKSCTVKSHGVKAFRSLGKKS